ncbi:hypothetical protein L1887_18040 [Cichorium endivia]|nr:hypothetical protein L1887_18040 [Cichorium endivia]
MRGKKSRRTSGVATDKGGDFRWLKIIERTAVGQRPVNEEGKETVREADCEAAYTIFFQEQLEVLQGLHNSQTPPHILSWDQWT